MADESSYLNLSRTNSISILIRKDDSRVYIDGGGEEMTYEFEIPEDFPPLFGFYHNHVHGTASYSFLSGL
jgi:hypothetical protein